MTLTPAVMTLLGDKAWWMPRWLERLLPQVDIEGEAVEHERAHADWPERDWSGALAADDLEVRAETRGDDVVLFSGASTRVADGGTLLVTADDPHASRAFLLTVAGRIAPSDGLLRVAGHLLPGRAAWVRAHTGVAELAGSDAPVTELRRALSGRTRFVVVAGLDLLSGSDRDQAAALLRDATNAVAARGGALTVVASARDLDAARSVLADAYRPRADVLRLAPPSPASFTAPAEAGTDTQVIPS